MIERKHLSVHIEKTAGTSLLALYEEMHGPKNVLNYYPDTDTVQRCSDVTLPRTGKLVQILKIMLAKTPLLPLVTKFNVINSLHSENKFAVEQFSPDSYNVIHGHFTANRFDNLFDHPFITVVFRDPLQRMVSHYLHWKRNHGHMIFRMPIPYDAKMNFSDFALLPSLKNYQTSILAGKDLETFDLTGTTDKIDLFASNLIHALKIDSRGKFDPSTPLQRLNTCPINCNPEKLGITPKFTDEFHSFHSEDYTNYVLASKLAEKQALLEPQFIFCPNQNLLPVTA